MAKTAQRCEQLGVKTAIAMLHMGADYRDAKFGAATIFNIPEVDAIVSMGFPYMKLTLPPVERVIGQIRARRIVPGRRNGATLGFPVRLHVPVGRLQPDGGAILKSGAPRTTKRGG